MNDNRALCAFVAANVLKAASHMTSHDHQKSASILQCLCALMDMAFAGDGDVGLFNATESLFYLLQNNTELSMQDLSLKEERVKSLMRFLSLKEEGLSLAQGKSAVHFDFTLTRDNDGPSRSITGWHHFLSNTSENTNNSHAIAQENPENHSEQHARDNNNDNNDSLLVLKNCHHLLREWLSDVTNNNNDNKTNNNKQKRGREELETLSTIVQDGGTILKKLKESIPTEQQKRKTSKSRTPSSSPNIVQID
ncbi:hypothetical protein AGDE_17178 [Angomonas deanei]|nr:hypothetical protein AGDE_17178 [Angomonas deanei]|eukprot:EPY15098.1 hypothetical protein AGDE_17178 [Angomonas deanei]